MADAGLQEQEKQVKKLKRLLEGWRMALLPLKSIMLWEQQWHPCAIIGGISFIYLVIWLSDLSMLATFASIGLLLNFMDFIVPVACNSIYGPDAWTGQKEKMYEDICKSIVVSYNKVLNHIRFYYSMREARPVLYHVLSSSILLLLTLISSSVNNVFLLYLLSTMMLLWPGIQHRGIFNTLLSMVNKGPKTSEKVE